MLNIKDLLDEYAGSVGIPISTPLLWDLSGHSIRPPLAVALLEGMVTTGTPQSDRVFLLDLSENLLGSATRRDFVRMVRALAAPGMERVRVRFGSEIVKLELQSAFKITRTAGSNMEDRIVVQSPWAEVSRRGVRDMQAQVTKDLSSCSTRVTNLENYTKTLNEGLEIEVAHALANYLGESEIIATAYPWARQEDGAPGKIDALVSGTLPGNGEPVVVLAEVKTNLKKKLGEARRQLLSNADRFQQLCTTDPNELDNFDYEDYELLQIDRLRDRKIVYAVGGSLMPSGAELERELNKDSMRGLLKGVPVLRIDPDSGHVSEVHL